MSTFNDQQYEHRLCRQVGGVSLVFSDITSWLSKGSWRVILVKYMCCDSCKSGSHRECGTSCYIQKILSGHNPVNINLIFIYICTYTYTVNFFLDFSIIQSPPKESLHLRQSRTLNFKMRLCPVWTNSMVGLAHPLVFIWYLARQKCILSFERDCKPAFHWKIMEGILQRIESGILHIEIYYRLYSLNRFAYIIDLSRLSKCRCFS